MLLVVAEVFLPWKPDGGVAMRWGREVLGPARRPQPRSRCAAPDASHHFNTALPLKNMLEVLGACC